MGDMLPEWAVSQIVQRAGRGISESDVDRIVRSVTDSASTAFDRIASRGEEAVAAHDRPSAVFRPALSLDGNTWCALYGGNLQDGVAGFGKSPAAAMAAFDRAWFAAVPSPHSAADEGAGKETPRG